MTGFKLTTVRMFSLRVSSATALIITIGPMASTRSMRVPFWIELAEFVSDEAFVGVAAIVGSDHERVAHSAKFLLEDHEFLRARTND